MNFSQGASVMLGATKKYDKVGQSWQNEPIDLSTNQVHYQQVARFASNTDGFSVSKPKYREDCPTLSNFSLGAVVCYLLNITWGWHLAIALPLSLIVCAICGLLIERLAVRPFAIGGSNSWLLTTIAVGIIGENLAMLTFGKEVRAYPSVLAQQPIKIFDFGVYPLELLIPLIVLAITVLIRWTFTHTLWGKAFLAVSENPDTALAGRQY